MNSTESIVEELRIYIAKSPPSWAEQGILALKAMPGISVSTDSTPTPDVILHYGDNIEATCQTYGYGRLGFWFFRIGHDNHSKAITAARQAAAHNLPLEISLWSRFADGRCECLYQSFGFLEPFAIKRDITEGLAKAAFFPNRILAQYLKTTILTPCNTEILPITATPAQARLAEAIAIWRKIIHKIFYTEQWFVVVGQGQALYPTAVKKNWQLDPGKHRFWADPFPLEYQGRRWIFVEELLYTNWLGHLAVIELFEDGTHSDSQPALVTNTHQSYPFVFIWNDELYMLPESSATGNIALWKCTNFPNSWQQVAVLLSDIYAADPTLIEYQGYWWLFVTLAPKGASLNDELHIYFANSPLGPWREHPKNPVKSDARSARPAGNFFVKEGVLYRPAQDCGSKYGKATHINRIDRLDIHDFAETQIATIDSNWYPDFLCSHTLSRSQNLWAVDGCRLLPKWRILLHNLIKKPLHRKNNRIKSI